MIGNDIPYATILSKFLSEDVIWVSLPNSIFTQFALGGPKCTQSLKNRMKGCFRSNFIILELTRLLEFSFEYVFQEF